MKLIDYTDANGYKYLSLLRDSDPDEMASQGILQGPPPLDELDWDAIKRDLHNLLMERDLFSYRDLQEKRGLRGAILSALRKRIIYLYREVEKNE